MTTLTDIGAIKEAQAGLTTWPEPRIAGAGFTKAEFLDVLLGNTVVPNPVSRLTARGNKLAIARDYAPVAHFDAQYGITSSGGLASQWSDLSGNSRHLLQGTGANQPIHLPFAGTKYGWLPGVPANYFSTPDSVPLGITGSFDVDFDITATDWTPAATTAVIGKDVLTKRSFVFGFAAGSSGLIQVFVFDSTNTLVINATSNAAPVVSDNSRLSIRVKVTWALAGDLHLDFYTSTDGDAWTQLGTRVTVAGGATGNAIGNFDNALYVGQREFVGSELPFSGKVHRVRIYNGFRDAGGTLVVDFDPSRWTSGSTFTAATGETWTINSTGSKPAQIVDRASLLFDGAAHYMKTAPFTLNQPETIYLVAKQVSWTVSDAFFDGNASVSALLEQKAASASPRIAQYAGGYGGESVDLAVGSSGVICTVFNGASSSVQVNANAASTGNAGAGNSGGFTLGARGGGTNLANIQAYEALIYNVAHDAATRSNIIRALMNKHNIT